MPPCAEVDRLCLSQISEHLPFSVLGQDSRCPIRRYFAILLIAVVQVSKDTEQKTIAMWVKRFAAFGVIVPVICLALGFEPPTLMNFCELCWPTGFLLFAADGKFNLVIYLSSIVFNALIWAGIGWVIGYGLSNRK